MERDAGAERNGRRFAVVRHGIALREDGDGLIIAGHGEQRLVQERENDAVIETLAVIRLQAVVRLIGEAEGLDLRVRFRYDGRSLRLIGDAADIAGLLAGDALVLGGEELLHEFARVHRRAAAKKRQRQNKRRQRKQLSFHCAASFPSLMIAA